MAVVTRRGKRIIYGHILIDFRQVFFNHVTSAYASYRYSRYTMLSLVIVGEHFDGFVEVRA